MRSEDSGIVDGLEVYGSFISSVRATLSWCYGGVDGRYLLDWKVDDDCVA